MKPFRFDEVRYTFLYKGRVMRTSRSMIIGEYSVAKKDLGERLESCDDLLYGYVNKVELIK